MSQWRLEWSVGEGAEVDLFRVRRRRPGGPWTPVENGETTATSLVVEIGDEGSVDFGVAPVVGGVEAPEEKWDVFHVADIAGAALSDIGRPPDVTNFSVEQDGDRLLARWDEITDERAVAFEIRLGPDWETGIVMPAAPLGANSASWGAWYAGSQTYHIAARSAQGLYSANPTSAAAIVTRADDYGVQKAFKDEAADAFVTGTMTGVEVVAGSLRPIQFPTSVGTAWTAATTTPWWFTCEAAGNYVTAWIDQGQVVDERIEVNPAFVVAASTFPWNQPSEPLYPSLNPAGSPRAVGLRRAGQEIDASGALVRGVDLVIEIDLAQDATPTPDGWRKWIPGATYRFRQYRLRFTMNLRWPLRFPAISGLTHRSIRLNKKDEGTLTLPGGGDHTVTFATPFTESPATTAVIVGAAPSAVRLEVVPIDETSFTLEAFDAVNASVAADVHWHAMGI